MKLMNLKTLQLTEPLGTGKNPYFSWMLTSEEPDTMQVSYRLTVRVDSRETGGTVNCMGGAGEKKVEGSRKESGAGSSVYDSGIVKGSANAYIAYRGKALHAGTKYVWSVTVCDNHGNTATASSYFETGLLEVADWTAKWARSPIRRKKGKPGFGRQEPATMFRKEFSLREKPVKARLYATCHGIYELYVNGYRNRERLFAPEHTVYEKYLCYQTYDLTDQLMQGKNVLGMYVGDGWYLCPQMLPNMKKQDYAHAVLFQLEITYADGSVQTVVSDRTVQAAYGPVRCSDLFAGEKYDANQETEGWSTKEFDAVGWQNCTEAAYGYENLTPQPEDPVAVVVKLPVKEILTSPKGECILDFGQVIAGRVQIRAEVPAGTEIVLEHCEVLDAEGNYFNNVTSAGGVGKGVDQKDVCISNGSAIVYEPHFTYHGFRYVRVSGIQPEAEDVTAIVLSTRKEDTGTFETSDARLNRLYENIRWSQRANMLSIPTDCPQREKAGWTGDMLVYGKTALLNEDCTPFFTRWLANMSCDQSENGSIPMVVPLDGAYPAMGKMINLMSGTKGAATSSGWGDAAVIVPYSMYQVTGNTEILKKQYTCMRRWCDYVIREAEHRKPKRSTLPEEIERYLWDTGYHYGEWLIPSQSRNGLDMKNLKAIMQMSACYTAPIFGWNSVQTFAWMAEILADRETDEEDSACYRADQKKYQEIADRMKEAIQKGVIREDGSMPSELMGAYVLPIYFDLVPERHKQKFADNLVRSIEKNDGCMDTGFLATPYLPDALCKIGRADLAYDLLWQKKQPSWLYEVDAGGTTIWENSYGYDEQGNPGNLSFNHYAFGAVAEWMFRYIGGIGTADAGYRHIVIAPEPDGRLTWAKRTFFSSQGRIACSWRIERRGEEQIFSMEVEIPCNTTAMIRLPDGTAEQVGSGKYQYEAYMTKDMDGGRK